jgi:uncharacterized repeat protein (TIGR01451 family)
MFNKLLANLPFNPSLVTQISFYGKRVKQESSIRRLGFIFVALTLAVQVFAVISPAQPSLAASTNDIIYGGFNGSNPKANLLAIYDDNSDGHNTGFQALYQSFGISRQDIVNSQLETINSGDHTLYSLGRTPHSALDQSYVAGGQQYYLRPLYTWGDDLSYQALVGTRSGVNGSANDKYFAVMLDCGNIVVKVTPQPQLTKPVKIARTDNGLPAANANVTPGELIGYRVFFNNNGAGAADNVELIDPIPAHTTYSWHGTGAATNGGQLINNQEVWRWTSMPAQAQNWYVDLNVQVAAGTPNGTKICNIAYLGSDENATQYSNEICNTVEATPTPTPTVTTTTTPTPLKLPSFSIPSVVAPTPTTQPNISRSKLASNITQGLADAQTKPAQAGDVIEYQLLTINSGSADAPNYQVTDQVTDIQEYADVTQISDGGILSNGVISWPVTTIKANSTLTRTFQIKVKDPIPSTPQSASDPQSFDLRMDNVYGNEVSINVQSPTIARTAEQVNTTLVNTGPGSSLIIGFVLALIVGYFLARSRLLAKEAVLVRNDYAHNGDLT